MARVGLMWMALMITGQVARTQGMPSHQTGGVRTRLARRLLNGQWSSGGGGDSSSEWTSEPGVPPLNDGWSESQSGGEQDDSGSSGGQQGGQQGKSHPGNGESSGSSQDRGQQQQHQGSNGSRETVGTIISSGYEFLARAFGQASVRIVPRMGEAQPCENSNPPIYYGQRVPGVLSSCAENP